MEKAICTKKLLGLAIKSSLLVTLQGFSNREFTAMISCSHELALWNEQAMQNCLTYTWLHKRESFLRVIPFTLEENLRLVDFIVVGSMDRVSLGAIFFIPYKMIYEYLMLLQAACHEELEIMVGGKNTIIFHEGLRHTNTVHSLTGVTPVLLNNAHIVRKYL